MSKKFTKRIIQHTIDQTINQLKNTSSSNNFWLCDFENLKACIYDYFQDVEEWTFQEIENETIQIDIFEYTYLLDNNNKIIIYVCIEMDEAEQGDYLTND
ncbi:19053_t:CDS:2, partial [Rhizophagus irregularis]